MKAKTRNHSYSDHVWFKRRNVMPVQPARGGGATSSLHNERINAVISELTRAGARTVLDLGCGEGELIIKLAQHERFRRIMGVDACAVAVFAARQLMTEVRHADAPDRIQFRHGSFTTADASLHGFDAAVLVETIEHIAPTQLGELERAVFECFAPRQIVITTPNREYNVLYGIGVNSFRHPDHQFEWCRLRFRRWAHGVARRNGYNVVFRDIGEHDEQYGAPTQMAIFGKGD